MALLKIEFTNRFKRQFEKLSAEQQKLADEKIRLFRQDPMHPSLRSKRVRGTDHIWETSINMALRFTWQRGAEEGVVILRNIGSHDPTLHRP